MSDTKIPPSAKPTSVLSVTPVGQKPAASVDPASPLRMLTDAPVKQAPNGLEKPVKREKIEGHVISYDRKSQELRIATPRGQITIKTDQPLPPGEDVVVELYVEKGVTLAAITLLREEMEAAAALEKLTTPPAPPLKAGDTAVAILITEEPPPEAVPAAKPTLQQVAQVLEQLQATDLIRLPQPLPLPPDIIMKLATAPDLFTALKSLPPAQQQAVIDYLAQPTVQDALPPPAARVLQQLHSSAVGETGGQETLEADLILRTSQAPVPARAVTAPDTPAAKAAPQSPLSMLQGLLPILEASQGMALPFGNLMRLMAAAQMPQSSPFANMMPQNMHQIKIISVTPPALPPVQGQPVQGLPAPQTAPEGIQPAPPAPNAPLTGVVESLTENGFPVIRAGENRFILKMASSVEVGSTVLFEAVPLTTQQAIVALQLGAPQDSGGFAGFSWPAMDETLDALPAWSEAGAALRNTLPTPTPRIVPTALFFLSALRMGAIESWLGNNLLDTLRQSGKSTLADRLTGDFAKLSAQAKEPVSGEWRMIQMPMLHDEQLSQMQFYLRRQQEENTEEGEQGTKPSTRFVLNLHLSRMGDLQLDGLMRQKRFDLIFRSGDALPLNMRQDLMQGFAKGLEQANMQGGISFQTRAQQWVTVELPQQGTLA